MRSNRQNILIIGASAGSGKTHRLSTEFVDSITGNGCQSVCPGNILATTFTNKAADELAERVRVSLLTAGEVDNSMLVQTGYVGTVNSVCGQLVQEYCFESGISPSLNILPAERVPLIFARATSAAIESISEEAERAAHRLSLPGWQQSVTRIASQARSNGISPDQLFTCGERSWLGIKALLPVPEGLDGEDLDRELAEALDSAIDDLERAGDPTKRTQEVLIKLKEKKATIRSRGELVWSDWAQLSKLAPGKASFAFVMPAIQAAGRHPFHPRLHADIKLYLNSLFECASQALLQYEDFKTRHAFIDFTDQEYLLLNLLKRSEVMESMTERVEVALIDEFQDTSPVQLEIFLRMAQLMNRSVWVGDEKQAIYGFRGTDARLMQELSNKKAEAVESKRIQLVTSYRSRPELVSFTNNAFSNAFSRCGMPPENVLLKHCNRPLQQDLDCALHVWQMKGKSWEQALTTMALRIKEIMECPSSFKVEDIHTKQLRPLRGADIAILCRTNDRCLSVADALYKQNVPVARKRFQLLDTPECVLAFAALRFLVDKTDTLAASEILRFTVGYSGNTTWLEQWLSSEGDQRTESFPILKKLNDARKKLLHLTPGEALELALSTAEVLSTVRRWDNTRQRLANLDSMRGLSRMYEEYCLAGRSAATPAGFVSYLFRDLPNGGEQTPVTDERAVNVLTYHGAKGLEWTFVLLLDLDQVHESDPFGTFVESDNSVPDYQNPLKGRWIRCWPWPYGLQKKGVYLDSEVEGSPEAIAASRESHEEAIRLLYVGMTRARDYLVFCMREKTAKNSWLDLLNGLSDEVNPVISFEDLRANEKQPISVNGKTHEIYPWLLDAPEEAVDNGSTKALLPVYFPRTAQSIEYLPYKLVPSKSADKPPELLDQPERIKVINLGERLPFSGNPDMERLGEVMHQFLAADPFVQKKGALKRIELATRLCDHWEIQDMPATAFLKASDRLQKFLDEHFHYVRLWREHAVRGRIGQQRINGRLDLLIELADSFVMVDHKTYPGRFETWQKKALTHANQLKIYAEVIAQVAQKKVSGLLVHLPVVGKMIDISECL